MRPKDIKNDENGAAMKKEDGCHKNQKTRQRTKRRRKGPKQGRRRLKN